MKALLFISLNLLHLFNSYAQQTNALNLELQNIHKRQVNIGKTSMISLNSWAITNIGYGTIASTQANGEAKYFHQMNAIWNVVNLGIGIPGIISAYKKNQPKDLFELNEYQHKIEKVYLINTGLDIAYIASGLALRNFGESKTGEPRLRLKGYGNAIMMQGGYLLIHDIAVLLMYKSNVKLLNKTWKNVKISSSGLNLKIEL